MPREQERYCAKLISDTLGGVEYIENYRFDFLRGNPTPKRPKGVTLPVDAYYPTHKVVLEFRESQHYGDRFAFRDGRITATGETRKEQRKKYDKKREELLPANGIKLLIIYDYQITGDYKYDLMFIKQAINELFRATNCVYNLPPSQAYRSFYRPSHRFRNEVSHAYSAIHWVINQAYPTKSESEFESNLINMPGLLKISNMLVVHIWTLFEVYMREAYVAIYDKNISQDNDVRNNNYSWGRMREWLTEKGMFIYLKEFDALLGEFCARRNCLVHNEGKVDSQYLRQVNICGGSSAYAEGDFILTEWRYHKKLNDALVNHFNLILESEVDIFPRENT